MALRPRLSTGLLLSRKEALLLDCSAADMSYTSRASAEPLVENPTSRCIDSQIQQAEFLSFSAFFV
jgi:hypothetical protein